MEVAGKKFNLIALILYSLFLKNGINTLLSVHKEKSIFLNGITFGSVNSNLCSMFSST